MEQELSLELYGDAQAAQAEGRDLDAALLFLGSVAATSYHPNAVYQACLSATRLGALPTARGLLAVLLAKTPDHEAGHRLGLVLAALTEDDALFESFYARRASEPADERRLQEAFAQRPKPSAARPLPPLRTGTTLREMIALATEWLGRVHELPAPFEFGPGSTW